MTSKRGSKFVYLSITLISLCGLLSGCGPSTAEVTQQPSFTETALPAATLTEAPAATATPTPLPTATAAPAAAPTPTTIPSPTAVSTPIGGGTGQMYLYTTNPQNEIQTWLADMEGGTAETPPDHLCSDKFSPDGNWLWCWRLGSFYVISRDGQTRYPFDSLNGMIDVSAYWLPDSERLILLALSPDPEGLPRAYHKLNVVNRDGTGMKQIDENILFSLTTGGIDLSPDGNYVVYQKYGRQVFVAHIDGSEILKLTTDYQNNDPFWSATGEYVYWSREILNSAGPTSIFRIKPDGSDQTLIFNGSVNDYWLPVCQHHASRTVLICQAISPRLSVTHLFAIDLENPNAEPRVLLEMESTAIANLIFIPAPDWSKIFVITFAQETDKRDYWIVNLETGEQARLPETVYRCNSFSEEGVTRWSPDSRLLALDGTVTPCQTSWPPGSGMNIFDADANAVFLSLTEPPFDTAALSFWVR